MSTSRAQVYIIYLPQTLNPTLYNMDSLRNLVFRIRIVYPKIHDDSSSLKLESLPEPSLYPRIRGLVWVCIGCSPIAGF